MKLVTKILLGLIAIISLAFILRSTASAKTYYAAPVASPTPTPMAQANSFELFWPMVAGKTMTSKIYFLKTLKEDVRGALIFGAPQKADYDTFISVKRLLEAEVLINASNSDLAIKTLNKANDSLTKASNLIPSSGDKAPEYETIKNRLDNLIKLVDTLSSKTQGDVKAKLGETHSIIVELLNKVK